MLKTLSSGIAAVISTTSIIPSTYIISGTVSAAGAILPGVTVTLSGTSSGSTTTDEHGYYYFTGLSAGVYSVSACKTNYSISPASISVTITNTNQIGKNFTAVRLYAISGTILEDASPLEGVTVDLSGDATDSTETDGDGYFEFTGLLAGTYTLTATLEDYTFDPESIDDIEISGADSTENDFEGTAEGILTYTTGLKIWLKADALSLNNNDPVDSWTDSSGNGYNFTSSGSARPTYATNVINGKPSVVFDGSNDILSLATSVKLRTVFILSNETRGNSTFSNYYGLLTHPTSAPYILGFSGGATLWNGATVTWFWNKDAAKEASFDYAPLATIKMFCAEFNQDYVGAWQIGQDRNIGGRFWKGNIIEVIRYDTILDATNITTVLNYLKTKYGIE